MPRRASLLLLALSLVVLIPLAAISPALAQDASPIAIDPEDAGVESAAGDETSPIPTETPAEDDLPDENGNTPAGSGSNDYIVLSDDVYVRFNSVTTGGNTTALEHSIDDDAPLPSGYRSDNARAFDLATTAGYIPNIIVCINFGADRFAIPAEVDLFRWDGSGWTLITATNDLVAVCGYTLVLGTFAVAEFGETPTVAPTETDTPATVPTDTPTATSTSAPTDIATSTPASTPEPTDTPSATVMSSATPSDTPEPTLTPTSTPTQTATETSEPTLTPSPSSSPTSSAMPTDTSTSTPTESPTTTSTGTNTPTASPTETLTTTPSPTETWTASPTPTSTPARTHFALPNVYLTFSGPVSGTTSGQVLDGSGLPSVPDGYLPGNAWFVHIETTANYTDRIKLCVIFDGSQFANPPALLRHEGTSWTPTDEQVFDSGAFCGYTAVLGDFALVERAPATVTPTPTATSTSTPTFTPSATPTSTETSTPSATASPTATPTETPTATASPTSTPTGTPTSTSTATTSATPTTTATATSSLTPSATATATETATQTATSTSSSTPSATATSTSTLGPGSYHNGSTLRATTRVNLRSGPSTSTTSKGVISTGTIVTVTGPSIAGGGYFWVPVSVPVMGTGWVAGDYLVAIPAATPTRTPAPATPTNSPGQATSTHTPGQATATRTPTRPPGGFIPGDSVRTTTRLNVRSGPSTSSAVLTVLPSNASGTITGPPVASGGYMFYPVRFDGYPAGYVVSAYLRQVGAAPTPSRTPSPSPTVAGNPSRWTTDAVNFRGGPGTNYRVIVTLEAGTRVSVIGAPQRSGGYDWYPVVINGVGNGWIAGSFLSIVPPL